VEGVVANGGEDAGHASVQSVCSGREWIMGRHGLERSAEGERPQENRCLPRQTGQVGSSFVPHGGKTGSMDEPSTNSTDLTKPTRHSSD
jgi:hypothetical protein